jgi:predicted Rossmann fold nucleotide-binding protein DprA/Smf involved in DNA uptake
VESQFKYSKEYNVKHFFIRNEAIIKYSNGVVAFITNGELTSGTANAVNHAKKHKKKIVFIS